MNRAMLGIALGGLLLGAVFGMLTLRSNGNPDNAPAVSGKALVGGPFSLIDQTGKRVTDQDFRGKVMLVFFGFTNCPDICPAGLQVMTAALEKLGTRADDIVPIFITLDPERDTPEKMSEYVKNFSPRLIGLTGSPTDIATVAKAYRVFYQKVPDEKDPSNYSVDHSAFFYLMNKDGSFLAPITITNDPAQLASSIDKALG
jgi:protein SCO1/2